MLWSWACLVIVAPICGAALLAGLCLGYGKKLKAKWPPSHW